MADNVRDVVIIGGGASGMTAALLLARKNLSVTILEKDKAPGKKLGITGNGKCNYTNMYQSIDCYNSTNPEKAYNIVKSFGAEGVIRLFSSIGIEPSIKKGRDFDTPLSAYVYPASENAKEFVSTIQEELVRLKVKIKTNTSVTDIRKTVNGSGEVFEIATESYDSSYSYLAKEVIVASGGFSLERDKKFQGILESLGHSIIKPLPALTSLKTDKARNIGSGFRSVCGVSVFVSENEAEYLIGKSVGEVQFGENTLSGIAVMQISGKAIKEMDKGNKTVCRLDFFREYDHTTLVEKLKNRRKALYYKSKEKFLSGFINSKIADRICSEILKGRGNISEITDEEINMICRWLKSFTFDIIGSGGLEHAQTVSGGIPLDEVDEALASRKCEGLYFTGEVLDVDGLCGGYNLTWAFSSAYAVSERVGRK